MYKKYNYNFRFNNRWSTSRKKPTSNEFDLLVFTQSWPLTVCYVWQKGSESHTCLLPKHNNWTIHGIWPTQYHTIGPEYCNKSLKFDATVLAPIEKQLKEYWIDVQNGSKPYSFWKHEWDKHGTCAVVLKTMDNQFKYFQAGLKFLKTYNMIDVLAKAGILSGQTYEVQDILLAIERILGKRGQVMCTKNQVNSQVFQTFFGK